MEKIRTSHASEEYTSAVAPWNRPCLRFAVTLREHFSKRSCLVRNGNRKKERKRKSFPSCAHIKTTRNQKQNRRRKDTNETVKIISRFVLAGDSSRRNLRMGAKRVGSFRLRVHPHGNRRHGVFPGSPW